MWLLTPYGLSWTWIWSNLTTGRDEVIYNNGSAQVTGQYRYINSVLLNNKVEAVEGLFVDTVNGGIGFRNHSAPPLRQHGSVWTEDLLFIQPVTQCVDTNLTLDFSLSGSGYSHWHKMLNVRLTDRGGFSELDLSDGPHKPTWHIVGPDSQRTPALWRRAYQAAWLHNAFLMAFMNVTSLKNESDPRSKPFEFLNSSVGKSFPLQAEGFLPLILQQPLEAIEFTRFGDIVKGTDMQRNSTYRTANTSTKQTIPPLYSNPYRIGDDHFKLIHLTCAGSGGGDLVNISNFGAKCSLVLGSPQQTDGKDNSAFHGNSGWKVPMYSCITATQALLKTVTFRFEGVDALSGLSVTDIRDKKYDSTDNMPLWGIESFDETTGWFLDTINPIWGLVSPELAVWVRFANPDYSRRMNLALKRRWEILSRSANTVAKIPNLIWTDLAANMVIGTKSLAGLPTDKRVLVTVYNKRIRYHMPYAVPAIIVLALLVLTSLSTACAALLGRTSLDKMKRYLNNTLVGRIMTITLLRESDGEPVPEEVCAERNGNTLVKVGSGRIKLLENLEEDVQDNEFNAPE
ncbi:hypothetical protein VTI28DRAFT_9678 [Corynascus sepedonium]